MATVRLPKQRHSAITVKWTRVSDAEWRAGNVRIIQCHEEGRAWPIWHVKLLVKGRWRWAYSSQRPWGYGSACQVKRGVSSWKNVMIYP